jgi:glucosylceramidase
MESFNNIKWIYTTPDKQWKENKTWNKCGQEVNLEVTDETFQTVKGFGGCFNELGWIALSYLSDEERSKVIKELFHPSEGCRFNICRLPIGASDYAAEWYSHNENSGDYGMEKFSIERDYKYLLPYIKEAVNLKSDMKLFASPWSPPTWMKFPRAYNYGTLIWEQEVLDAYALYFVKFVKAYEEAGIRIDQVHVQNEPRADQKFPSCRWTGEQLRDFIKFNLGPVFEKNNITSEIWLGTLNSDDYDSYANTVLSDDETRKYVSGVGYQWAGKAAIQRTYESWPHIRLMQTENECGDGTNTWEYSRYIFNLFKHYFNNGVESYIYWNMVLLPEGMSTWGWKQNSLITIDPVEKKAVFNPEFYVMKHFSHFVEEGAVRVGLKGQWSGNSVAFKNPNGETVVVVSNPFNYPRPLVLEKGGQIVSLELQPFSFNTLVLEKGE